MSSLCDETEIVLNKVIITNIMMNGQFRKKWNMTHRKSFGYSNFWYVRKIENFKKIQ